MKNFIENVGDYQLYIETMEIFLVAEYFVSQKIICKNY